MSDEVKLPEGKSTFKLNEVCKLANVQPYMLRFWGSEFPRLEAEKSGTGQRLYSRQQVEMILEIRRLLFDEGLTIAGARKRITADLPPEPKAARGKRKKPASAGGGGRRSAARSAPPQPGAEVDKASGERVQRLLSTLRDVRSEIAAIMSELDHS